MKNYSLNGLRMFEVASRHQSFSSAAEELNVSQSAVSQQIRQLEQRLNSSLFVRRAAGVELTVAGRDLANAVGVALFKINQSISRITQERDGQTLVVSTLSSFATKWLIPRIAAFEREHSNISLLVHASDDKIDFSSSGVDVAIRLCAKNEPDVYFEPVFKDFMCLVASPELAAEIGEQIENLYDHELIVDGSWYSNHHAEDLTRAATERSLDALGLDQSKLNLSIQSGSTTVVLFALANKGVALTRYSLCMDDIGAGKLKTVLDFQFYSEIEYSIVYPSEKAQSTVIVAFREWIKQEFARSPSFVSEPACLSPLK